MKLKPKGRKIYRYKSKNDRLKGFLRNTGAVAGTLLAAAAIGFVGYSAAGPILKFLENKEIVQSSQEPADSSAEPTPSDSGTPAETQPSTETEMPPQSSSAAMQELSGIKGAYLSETVLSAESALQQELSQLPSGTTHVAVTLKAKGGFLYYASSVEDAALCGAVVAAMDLDTICSKIRDAGYTPVACINALEDSVYPRTFASAGYQTITGDKWLYASDVSAAAPMMSPFSNLAAEYLTGITAEISAAGFEMIICQGLIFPDFTEEDLAVLDAQAGAHDRYTALAEIAEAMCTAAGDAAFLIELDGQRALDGGLDAVTALGMLLEDGVLVTVDDTTIASSATLQNAFRGTQCLFLYKGSTALTNDRLAQLTVNESYFIHPDASYGVLAP